MSKNTSQLQNKEDFEVKQIQAAVSKLEQGQPPENLVDFRTVQLIIETDKESYALGETIKSRIYINNPTSENVSIRPITSYSIIANSNYDPNPIARSTSISYSPGAYITINANGKYFLDNQRYTSQYPGPFTISCLGMKKTVNMSGYKEVSLNSSGISLEIQTSQIEFKVGDQIEVYLVIRNSNPYPVKVPVFQNMTPSKIPLETPIPGFFVEWVMPFFEVEANSTRRTWTNNVTLGRTHYSKYWYVDGQQAFIEFEVAPN